MSMTTDYPRDLIGYGRDLPEVRWPGQARVAVQFVLNYEEGGENCVLHGDSHSERFLSETHGFFCLAACFHIVNGRKRTLHQHFFMLDLVLRLPVHAVSIPEGQCQFGPPGLW